MELCPFVSSSAHSRVCCESHEFPVHVYVNSVCRCAAPLCSWAHNTLSLPMVMSSTQYSLGMRLTWATAVSGMTSQTWDIHINNTQTDALFLQDVPFSVVSGCVWECVLLFMCTLCVCVSVREKAWVNHSLTLSSLQHRQISVDSTHACSWGKGGEAWLRGETLHLNKVNEVRGHTRHLLCSFNLQ